MTLWIVYKPWDIPIICSEPNKGNMLKILQYCFLLILPRVLSIRKGLNECIYLDRDNCNRDNYPIGKCGACVGPRDLEDTVFRWESQKMKIRLACSGKDSFDCFRVSGVLGVTRLHSVRLHSAEIFLMHIRKASGNHSFVMHMRRSWFRGYILRRKNLWICTFD